MRKLTLFLTVACVLTCVSGLLAQTNIGVVSINGITHMVPGDNTKLRAGSNHVVSFQYDLTGLPSVGKAGKWVVGNGWEVYSPEGADWVNLTAQDGPIINALPGDDAFTRYHKYYTSINSGTTFQGKPWLPPAPDEAPFWSEQPGGNPTNAPANRAAYSLGSFSTSAGIIGNTVGIAVLLEFSTLLPDAGKTMCIDSMKAGAGWEWAPLTGTADRPKWDGDPFTAGIQSSALCLEIFEVENIPPVWCSASDDVEFKHCEQGSFTLCATDGGDGPGPMSYSFAPGYETGFGQLVGPNWTWSGLTVPQSGMTTVEFIANDGVSPSTVNFQLHVTTTNDVPTVVCPDKAAKVQVGKCADQIVVIGDEICDVANLVFGITGYTQDPLDADGVTWVKVDNTHYKVTYCPTVGPAMVDMPVTVFDGELTGTCTLSWDVSVGADYQVLIGKIREAFQGQITQVPIMLYQGVNGLGGFDFLVAYDASALAFRKAVGGDIYGLCGWEYFTYRFGAYGNCNGACPSGLLRVIGMAETNNGPYHPSGCGDDYMPATLPVSLAVLEFLVSNDRTLECQFVPIRFFWDDCGDNTISNPDGSILYVAQDVYDFYDYEFLEDGVTPNQPQFQENKITGDGLQSFPTYLGTRNECICSPNNDPTCKLAAIAAIGFQNGGVDIACADLIDDRGDINMNGLGYEIADAVMFTNYFIQGLTAFGPTPANHQEGSIAASDTNADGLALTVADLVYLIRVIVGDAQQYDKVAPVAASVTYSGGVFNVDAAMGAAFIVVSGDEIPTLLANNMEIKYASDGENTRILVFSIDGNSFTGDFLSVGGNVISTEFASANGNPVVAKVMPANFALHQNYPNPFNPTTRIKIDVPKAGVEWTLNIYNVTGQLVQTMSGKSTGFDEVVWDASNNASGIYFYKLTAGDFSATKKAVLLK